MTVRENKVVEVVAGRGNILDMVVEEASRENEEGQMLEQFTCCTTIKIHLMCNISKLCLIG